MAVSAAVVPAARGGCSAGRRSALGASTLDSFADAESRGASTYVAPIARMADAFRYCRALARPSAVLGVGGSHSPAVRAASTSFTSSRVQVITREMSPHGASQLWSSPWSVFHMPMMFAVYCTRSRCHSVVNSLRYTAASWGMGQRSVLARTTTFG